MKGPYPRKVAGEEKMEGDRKVSEVLGYKVYRKESTEGKTPPGAPGKDASGRKVVSVSNGYRAQKPAGPADGKPKEKSREESRKEEKPNPFDIPSLIGKALGVSTGKEKDKEEVKEKK